ncbi:MAG: ABC transporter permease subunit [Clostridia bacterium]|nr:ABC transporter permease subunit [Clostridia bacterium]
MKAIIKREFNSYFTSPIGYIVLAAFFAFAGFYFYVTCLIANSSNLSYTFSNIFIITIFLIPILTMRVFSEEKKQKTDVVLFTSPVKLYSVVLGKFVASLSIFSICISINLLFAVIIAFFTQVNVASVLGNFLGLFLLSATLISIGIFLSSLTENQIISAISCIGVGLFILLFDTLSHIIQIKFISNIFSDLSFMSRYDNFTLGIINFSDVVFFLSVCAIFLFLTVRVFEKKRWD